MLRDVDFRAGPGECIALTGPNGSGKSTLLKTLTKTLAPLAGDLELDGHPIASLSYRECARRLAYVPQEEAIAFPFLAREVVAMGRLALDDRLFETPADHEAVRAALDQVDVGHLAERPITELSGGERQRVLIARALAQEAPILLMDEPAAHLDVAHQVALAELITHLAAEGRTVVMAIHDLNFALEHASRVLVLGRCQVCYDGVPGDLRSHPVLQAVFGVRFVEESRLRASRLDC